MAALAGNLETLWCRRVKLLPCVGRPVINEGFLGQAELIHRMLAKSALFRELSASRSVYPGVECRRANVHEVFARGG